VNYGSAKSSSSVSESSGNPSSGGGDPPSSGSGGGGGGGGDPASSSGSSSSSSSDNCSTCVLSYRCDDGGPGPVVDYIGFAAGTVFSVRGSGVCYQIFLSAPSVPGPPQYTFQDFIGVGVDGPSPLIEHENCAACCQGCNYGPDSTADVSYYAKTDIFSLDGTFLATRSFFDFSASGLSWTGCATWEGSATVRFLNGQKPSHPDDKVILRRIPAGGGLYFWSIVLQYRPHFAFDGSFGQIATFAWGFPPPHTSSCYAATHNKDETITFGALSDHTVENVSVSVTP
jgi:hypothetical protein